jgi:hypothetical protein
MYSGNAPSIVWAKVPVDVWLALAWTVLPTTVYGFLAWNWSMRRTGAVAANELMYLIPVFGALAAWAGLRRAPARRSDYRWNRDRGKVLSTLRWDTMISGGYVPRLPPCVCRGGT